MRIIIADPHEEALWALRTTIQADPRLELVGEATNSEELIADTEAKCADLVLVDVSLPGVSIEEVIRMLHRLEARPVVIVLGSRPDEGRRVLRAGADAFVSKGDEPKWLLDTLHRYAARINSSSGIK